MYIVHYVEVSSKDMKSYTIRINTYKFVEVEYYLKDKKFVDKVHDDNNLINPAIQNNSNVINKLGLCTKTED